jgi:hypothetical protein
VSLLCAEIPGHLLFQKGELDLFETVKMSAVALRHMMNETFDYNKFEQGRQEARAFFHDHSEQREEKLAEIKRRIENCDFKHTPGASYWIGCLSEADFS